jgi:hypothetical protein
MKKRYKILLMLLSVLTLPVAARADFQKVDDILYNALHSGKVWGQLQSITMTQNWDEASGGDRWGGEASSSSMSVKLGYETQSWKNISLGAELQKVMVVWEENEDDEDAKKNNNSNTESINQLYLKYESDWQSLQAGRQYLKLEFLIDNPIRSKMHYYEGIIYRGDLPSEFDVLFGYVSKFSGLSKEWFKDIDSTFMLNGAIDRNGNKLTNSAKDNIGDTDGVYLGYLTWKGLSNTTAQVYDYWFDDIINIVGGNLDVNPPIGPVKGIFKARLARQDSIGDLDDIALVDSYLAEISAGLKYREFELQMGYTTIGDPEENETNQIFAPYDSAFIADKGMLGSGTLGSLKAGADTLWGTGRYNTGNFKSLFILWLTQEDNHDDNVELNIILTYYFSKHFYGQAKTAFGKFENFNGPEEDMDKQDMRLFLGYKF